MGEKSAHRLFLFVCLGRYSLVHLILYESAKFWVFGMIVDSVMREYTTCKASKYDTIYIFSWSTSNRYNQHSEVIYSSISKRLHIRWKWKLFALRYIGWCFHFFISNIWRKLFLQLIGHKLSSIIASVRLKLIRFLDERTFGDVLIKKVFFVVSVHWKICCSTQHNTFLIV